MNSQVTRALKCDGGALYSASGTPKKAKSQQTTSRTSYVTQPKTRSKPTNTNDFIIFAILYLHNSFRLAYNYDLNRLQHSFLYISNYLIQNMPIC